jgi:hypothetical protein
MVSELDIVILENTVIDLARLLLDFKTIYDSITAEFESQQNSPASATPSSTEVAAREKARIAALLPLLNAMPGTSPGLLAQVDSNKLIYSFLFDVSGIESGFRKRVEAAVVAPQVLESGALPRDLIADLNAELKFFDDLNLAITRSGLTLGQLVECDVLPRSIREDMLEAYAAELRDVLARQ